jgi:hypothetical protein
MTDITFTDREQVIARLRELAAETSDHMTAVKLLSTASALSVPHQPDPCPKCSGSGKRHMASRPEDCIACDGTGHQPDSITSPTTYAPGRWIDNAGRWHDSITEPLPEIALRDDPDGVLDDVVVKGVEMFRAEMMDDRTLWLCCYLTNGERITWGVHSPRKPLVMATQEMPMAGTFIDFDAKRKQTTEQATPDSGLREALEQLASGVIYPKPEDIGGQENARWEVDGVIVAFALAALSTVKEAEDE